MKTAERAGKQCVSALLVAGLLVAGCGQAKKEKPEAAPSRSVEPKIVEVQEADADLLQNVPVGAASTNAALAEGDRAWQDLAQLIRPPSYPPEWETNEPSKEAVAEFERSNALMAVRAADKAKEFYAKFPTHEMASGARDRELYLLGVAVQLGNTNVAQRLTALEAEKLKDPKLSEEERLQLRLGQLQRATSQGKDEDSPAALTETEKGARALMKEFPNRPELAGLLISVAEGWIDHDRPEKARTLAKEAADGGGPAELQTAAEALLKKLDRLGKPLAIKFKAIDSREVDLEALKGKVVLVDFWATWCAPCMAELPKVKAAYEKLHAKGFEIVGISLDREKQALEKIVAREKIAWPQHFDDGGEGNKFGEEFGIESIPTMWLVDKKGNLRELNGREHLVERVEKLLAE